MGCSGHGKRVCSVQSPSKLQLGVLKGSLLGLKGPLAWESWRTRTIAVDNWDGESNVDRSIRPKGAHRDLREAFFREVHRSPRRLWRKEGRRRTREDPRPDPSAV
ncbi:hypothetical protein H671_1g0163 [Cricetulus griseus]|nr:hypothetical protein H671_1g0163 [Cricetulus griseus]